ncbi:MAG TPA: YihY/virulence factor BrkB family protein [Steroidobacteraceae bacterium]|nr:YihY/virulence factor BrkB family protein [Steroidobacteraceae bacterium]
MRALWQFTVHVSRRLERHNAALMAGAIAMYGLLSAFPGLGAAVSIYGLFATPTDVIQHMKLFAGVFPPGVWSIFSTQLGNVAAHSHGTLTVAAAIGVLLALWSARLTVSSLMTATNIACGVRERRGYVRHTAVSLALTLALILGFLVMGLVGVVMPLALAVLGTRPWVQDIVTALRWLLLWAFAVLGLAVVYRYAPARKPGPWRGITWGSATAATLWLAASALFAVYVRLFAAYDRTYGPLGGAVVLLVWFYLLSFIVIVGAEIDAARQPRAAPAATTPRAPASHTTRDQA